jgi:hypothetical protein
MTDIVDVEGSNRLPELAARIKAEHEACTAALKRGIEHAVAAGKLLIEAKAQLPHGQWLPWLREHCQIPERSARRYMQKCLLQAACARTDRGAGDAGCAIGVIADRA